MNEANIKITSARGDVPFVSTRNACKLCSPLGACIVYRGIENCIPLIHGSQGCSTYIRRYIISHFREPLDIASSNFSETSAIFGGETNLEAALDNVIRQYNPHAIGIASTCLSETIGDDVARYVENYTNRRRADNPAIIHASTASYRGTHVDGFHEAISSTIDRLAEKGKRNRSVNIIPGLLSPDDLRHLNEILNDYGVDYTLFPDYSDSLDGESWESYQKVPPGGTPLGRIRRMGSASATIQLGRTLGQARTGARVLEDDFGVKGYHTGIPIGILETDRFFATLEKITGMKTPRKYEAERGRLIDSYIDGHKYVFGKRAVVFGDGDLVVGLASFLDETGFDVVLCATGARTGRLSEALGMVIKNSRNVSIMEGADFESMLEQCRGLEPEMIIGSSKGYYLSRNLGIPLIRVGFPVHDRIGGQRILHVSYRGAQRLYDTVVNTLLEHRQYSTDIGYSYM